MKEYKDMSMQEISEIIKKGGDRKRALDYVVSEYLDSLDLSQKALCVISDTPINNISDAFAGLFTVEEVEEYISEYYE